MKRTSLILALLVLVPAASQARNSQRYRIRYSPYAFSYHNSGLIPGGIKYSPYAFTPSRSGLVYEGTRYTPYAFSYHNPGLVVDYYWWQAPVCPPGGVARDCVTARSASRRSVARRAAAPRHAISSAKLREIRETDGMHVIRQYLKDHGLADAQINYRLGVKNQTASVAFILREKGLLIRYCNPEIMESMATGSEPQRKTLERHEKRWEGLAKTFEKHGGSVYCVNTADKKQMIAALDNCDALVADGEALRPTRLYAKD